MEYGKNFETEFVEGYGATEPVSSPGGDFASQPQGEYGKTMPVSSMEPDWENMDDTLPPEFENRFETSDFRSDPMVEDYEDATQPVILDSVEGFTPVVGWLVCIDGSSKGSDYRLRAGYNYIGRAEYMDVCIKGDKMIGRERHAMVAYDHEERVFFFGPVDGKSTVRLNGKMVMVPSELHAYDILKIGATKLMFVPLCGEGFNWDV